MGDPVGSGLVSSLARPGGNLTGFSGALPDICGKWLELLQETIPRLSTVAVLADGCYLESSLPSLPVFPPAEPGPQKGTRYWIAPVGVRSVANVSSRRLQPQENIDHAIPMSFAPLRNSAAPSGSNGKEVRNSARL
jgi:hypothetical protein